MSRRFERVVFDCNVYFQALISPEGPSAQCLIAAARGQVILYCSEHILEEFVEVAARPRLRTKFGITDDRVERLIDAVHEAAEFVETVPEVFRLARDPDDSHYINLAAATGSKYVVTRDNDLLDLMEGNDPDAIEFRRQFPALEVIVPQSLLSLLAEKPAT